MDAHNPRLNFQQDVIQRSHQQPVLVDFWAPWCGPCRSLGPILDQLADEFRQRLDLVKINTEQEQELASQFGIRSIPLVKLFVDGEVAAEFSGALPEAAIREWLNKNLPSPFAEQLAQAQNALSQHDVLTAQTLLEPVLQEEPDNTQAQLMSAKACLWSEPEHASTLLGKIPLNADEATQAEHLLELARTLHQPPQSDGSEAASACHDALSALGSGDVETASDKLLESLKADRKYADGAARKAMLGLMAWLDPDQSRVTQLRSQLSAVLFR